MFNFFKYQFCFLIFKYRPFHSESIKPNDKRIKIKFVLTGRDTNISIPLRSEKMFLNFNGEVLPEIRENVLLFSGHYLAGMNPE